MSIWSRALNEEQTLLPSPRNSVDGHLALLESTSCSILISPAETKVDHITSKREMRHFTIEGLRELVRGNLNEHCGYDKTFEEAAQDPFIIVHTSGSTGLPKPITLYHGGVASVDSQHLITALDGNEAQIKANEGHIRLFPGLPPFLVGLRSPNKFVSDRSYYADQVSGGGYLTDPINCSIFRGDNGLAARRSTYQC